MNYFKQFTAGLREKNLQTNVVFASLLILFINIMHQSIPAVPIPPPPPGQLRGICTHCQSRGSGISLPKGHPHGFWLEIQMKTILSEKTSSLSLIGLSVKDWTKLWRLLKVCFLDFRHFLIVYQATTLKRDRERSLSLCISRSKRMRRYPGGGGGGAFALFFHPHPREFATQNKKSANARGLAQGGGGDGRSWNWLMHNFLLVLSH